MGDAIRNITASISSIVTTEYGAFGAMSSTIIPGYPIPVTGNSGGVESIQFDSQNTVPTALENRPASISSYLCIRY